MEGGPDNQQQSTFTIKPETRWQKHDSSTSFSKQLKTVFSHEQKESKTTKNQDLEPVWAHLFFQNVF